MRFARWITKSTNTQSEHGIPPAFQRQERLHKRTSQSYVIHTLPVLFCLIWRRFAIGLLVSGDILPEPWSSISWEGYIFHTLTEKLHWMWRRQQKFQDSNCVVDGSISVLNFLIAARSEAQVCGRSPSVIVNSNPTSGMDFCLLWVLCVLSGRGLCD
jgi:hypothetical protein